ERDQNFRITTATAERFILKIANRDEDLGVVDLQVRGLLHVERIDPSLQVWILTLGRNTVRRRLRDACRFPPYRPEPGDRDVEDERGALLAKRRRFLGQTLELSYDNPVHVVKGRGPWLFASDGSRVLDAYNNVPHVGHAHPHVARAVARQAAILNTNTRYLYR